MFHDCIYDVTNRDNEEKSAEFFLNCCLNKDDVNIIDVYKMILDTKSHKSNNSLSNDFINYDMNIVERDFSALLEWENGIYGEFQIFGNEIYKEHRLKFLESLLDIYPENFENLSKLIECVKENYNSEPDPALMEGRLERMKNLSKEQIDRARSMQKDLKNKKD